MVNTEILLCQKSMKIMTCFAETQNVETLLNFPITVAGPTREDEADFSRSHYTIVCSFAIGCSVR